MYGGFFIPKFCFSRGTLKCVWRVFYTQVLLFARDPEICIKGILYPSSAFLAGP